MENQEFYVIITPSGQVRQGVSYASLLDAELRAMRMSRSTPGKMFSVARIISSFEGHGDKPGQQGIAELKPNQPMPPQPTPTLDEIGKEWSVQRRNYT